jgi:hypothetical protein
MYPWPFGDFDNVMDEAPKEFHLSNVVTFPKNGLMVLFGLAPAPRYCCKFHDSSFLVMPSSAFVSKSGAASRGKAR